MNIVIAGSRDWPASEDYRIVRYVEEYVSPSTDVVLSGTARGPDTIAAKAARSNNVRVMEFRADWEHLGRSAGYVRNEAMVSAADKVVAFWDGESRGTKHSIDLALKKRKDLVVFFP